MTFLSYKVDGVVASARGCLPCPFWQGHTELLLLLLPVARKQPQATAAAAAVDLAEPVPEPEEPPLALTNTTTENPLAAAIDADDYSFSTWADQLAEVSDADADAAAAVVVLGADPSAAGADAGSVADGVVDGVLAADTTADVAVEGGSEQGRSAEPEPEPEPEPPSLVVAEGGGGPASSQQSADPPPDPSPKEAGPLVPVAMDCHCGAIDMSTIERMLLDPRNRSPQFWREKQADSVIHSLVGVSVNEESNDGWSRETELLGRGFCPANMHDTARIRVALLEDSAANVARMELAKQWEDELIDPEEVAMNELKLQVVDALDRGASLQCPCCGVRAVKDDACVHMDSCPCGSHWCFLCGKECGRQEGQCPRGEGGCDQRSCFLEQMEGWNSYALPGENAAFGAQKEFLRKRQAYLIRKVKEGTDKELWEKLMDQHPKILCDVPTEGRSIGWGDLDLAEFPLFGANLAAGVDGESLINDEIAIADDDAAQQRMETHWADLRREAEAAQRRERLRKRQKALCPPVVAAFLGALIVTAHLVPAPNPAIHATYEGCCDTPQAFSVQVAAQQGFYTVLKGCRELCAHDYCSTDRSEEWIENGPQSAQQWGESLGVESNTMDACCCCGGGRKLFRPGEDGRVAITVPQNLYGAASGLSHVNWTNTTGASCRAAPTLAEIAPNCTQTASATANQSSNTTFSSTSAKQPCGSALELPEHNDGTPEIECDWACFLLFCIPLVELIIATTVFLIAMLIDLDSIRTELRNDCFLITTFLVACPAVAYWPVLFDAEDWAKSSWFVVYVVAPFCAGGLGAMWCFGFWLNVFVTKLIAEHREPSETFLGLSFLLGFAVYLGLVVAFHAMLDDDHQEDESEAQFVEPLVTYTCTWPCAAFFWVTGGTLLVNIVMLGVDIVGNWRHVWRSGWYWRIPLTFVILVDTVGWPLLVGSEIANPQFWYFYIIMPPIVGLSWAGIMSNASQHFPNNRLEIIGLEWHLSMAMAILGMLLSAWLLWVFRHSVDPAVESMWTQIVFWEIVILGLVGGLLATYIRLYDRTNVSWWSRTMWTCGWPVRDFVLKMMNFVLKMMDFMLKMMDCAQNMRRPCSGTAHCKEVWPQRLL